MKLLAREASKNLESSNIDLPEQMTAQIAMSQELPTSTPAYLGIEFGQDGVTPNDPGDLDGLQNFPVLESATTVDGSTTIDGTLNSLALSQFRIDLYSSSYDTQVIRAGEVFLGSVEVSTDAAGNASFAFASPLAVPVGQFVISTATRLDDLDTSEFSDGIQVGAVSTLPPLDTVGPTISNLLLPNPKTKGTPLVLTFSEALDVASAVNLANYLLVTAGRDKRFGTKDDKKIALRSATYNPTTHTVTLVPRRSSPSPPSTASPSTAPPPVGSKTSLVTYLMRGDGGVSSNYVTIFKLTQSKARC